MISRAESGGGVIAGFEGQKAHTPLAEVENPPEIEKRID